MTIVKKFSIFYNKSMEYPHEDYHVRPFPNQPKRGGKDLINALRDLESMLGEEVPNLDRLRDIQAQIHASANVFNDDRLVDRLRMLSNAIDQYLASPQTAASNQIAEQVMRILVELKHL